MEKKYTNVTDVKPVKTTLTQAYEHLEEVKTDLKKELKKYWQLAFNISSLTMEIEKNVCIVQLSSSSCDFTIHYNLKDQSKKFVKASNLNIEDAATIIVGLDNAFNKTYGRSLKCYNYTFSTSTF